MMRIMRSAGDHMSRGHVAVGDARLRARPLIQRCRRGRGEHEEHV